MAFCTYFPLEASHPWKNHPLLQTPQPTWNSSLNFEEIERRLASEKIILLIPMRDYLEEIGKKTDFQNLVYLAILESRLKAVFKPDLEYQDMYAELAAYKASQWMNARLVPPTVIKRHKTQIGSLQFLW